MQRLRDNALSIAFGLLFLVTLSVQSVVGWHVHQDEASAHGETAMGYWRFVVSSEFGQAVLENWQSEYLQFVLFILLTVWLVQRGSPESKVPGEEGLGSDEEQQVGRHATDDSPPWARAGGWRTRVFSSSLLTLMTAFFLLSWAGQSLTGWRLHNEEQAAHHEAALSWFDYVRSAHFWEPTLQNWQSEFLAVGTFAIVTVFLRQRGSPESKPVGAPHAETGTSG
jgi:hypothetical protein